jgi:hypothetical protein
VRADARRQSNRAVQRVAALVRAVIRDAEGLQPVGAPARCNRHRARRAAEQAARHAPRRHRADIAPVRRADDKGDGVALVGEVVEPTRGRRAAHGHVLDVGVVGLRGRDGQHPLGPYALVLLVRAQARGVERARHKEHVGHHEPGADRLGQAAPQAECVLGLRRPVESDDDVLGRVRQVRSASARGPRGPAPRR